MNENKTGGSLERLSAAKTNERDAVVSNISVDGDTELSLDELDSVSGGMDWRNPIVKGFEGLAELFVKAAIYDYKNTQHMSVEDIIAEFKRSSNDGTVSAETEQLIRELYNMV